MKKSMIILILISLINLSTAFSQIFVSIPYQTFTPGTEEISIPIRVTNFNDIGQIKLVITYLKDSIEFIRLENPPEDVEFSHSASEGVLTIERNSTSPLNLANRKLVDLVFKYLEGESLLEFDTEQSKIQNSADNLLDASFCHGRVSNTTIIKLPILTVVPGENIVIPLNVMNFYDVGSFTLAINFDETSMTFLNIENAPSGCIANVDNGVLYIVFYGLSPINIEEGKLLDIVFSFHSNTSPLEFNIAECEVTNSLVEPIPTIFEDGLVSYLPIVCMRNQIAGKRTSFSLPIEVTNFNNIGSISLPISFQQDSLEYSHLENSFNDIDFVVTSEDGSLHIEWSSSTDPINLGNGKLVDLIFLNHAKRGPSPFEFVSENCIITNQLGETIAFFFEDGIITTKIKSSKKQINLPSQFVLYQNYPNPFNSTTQITYYLPQESYATLIVYNFLGKKVRTLTKREQLAGFHTTNWDGRDEAGNQVASGMYFYQLQMHNSNSNFFVNTKKMLLVK